MVAYSLTRRYSRRQQLLPRLHTSREFIAERFVDYLKFFNLLRLSHRKLESKLYSLQQCLISYYLILDVLMQYKSFENILLFNAEFGCSIQAVLMVF